MASPQSNSFTLASGKTTVRLGREAPPRVVQPFDTVTSVDATSPDWSYGTAASIEGKTLILNLHGVQYSQPGRSTTKMWYTGTCSGELAHGANTAFSWNFSRGILKAPGTNDYIWGINPEDYFPESTAQVKCSRWIGFTNMTGSEVNCITERRLETLLEWARTNAKFNPKTLCCAGFSMGAYGTLSFALRRPDVFAALYPEAPQWRYGYDVAAGSPLKFAYADYVTGSWLSVTPENSPVIRDADGGGKLFDRVDHLSYISDPSRKIPWIGWATGSDDDANRFEDHIEAVRILRATGRGFAFYWDAGGHVSGRIAAQITKSYIPGTFKIGEGYPCFSNHSRDQIPGVDPVGGINIGLTFRLLEESSQRITFEITNVDGPCEVDVTPISDKFKAKVPAQRVVVPQANTWVQVTFPAA